MAVLEVLICTINKGILKVADNILPPKESVKYLISWQHTDYDITIIPSSLQSRTDVRIINLEGKGLSTNRNYALKNAIGDILLFSDDDAKYSLSSLQFVIDAFNSHPKADILTFQMADEQGRLMKKYPKESFEYVNRPKGMYYSSIEIALRKTSNAPTFDERFGLGAEYLGCGEEEIFLHQASQRGLSILYIPQIIVFTPQDTTGSRFHTDVKVRRSKGAVLYMIHGYLGAVLRCCKYALSLKEGNKLGCLKDMYDGIQYIKKNAK